MNVGPSWTLLKNHSIILILASHWGNNTQEKLSSNKRLLIIYDTDYKSREWLSEVLGVREEQRRPLKAKGQHVQRDIVLTDVPGMFVYGYRPYNA